MGAAQPGDYQPHRTEVTAKGKRKKFPRIRFEMEEHAREEGVHWMSQILRKFARLETGGTRERR